MKPRTSPDQPELSRPVAVDKISAGGALEKIEADHDERELLAERFGLIDLTKLEAKITVKPARGGRMFEVEGTMQADVVQRCVVTLEPLPAQIALDIKVIYAAPEWLETEAVHEIDLDAEDTEPILGGIIDLGELVAQNLGIALDPYPRKKGVAYVEAEYGAGGDKVNPFAKLASLTKKGKGKK
jgi:uncharacterized metal-binding protein YceD (DUF177 family)